MSIQGGVALFNERRFWHAHEAWEELWLVAEGEQRQFLQGLIQLAAAYHHVQRGTKGGAARLFDAALRRLEPFPPGWCGVERESAIEAAGRHRKAIAGGEPMDAFEYPKLGYNAALSSTLRQPHASEG